MSTTHKKIWLESGSSRPITITPEAFERIQAIVATERICSLGNHRYTPENPMVAENVCLQCFLQHIDSPARYMSYIGEVTNEHAERSGYKISQFIDRRGYIHLALSWYGFRQTLDCSIPDTLAYHGFLVPTSHEKNGKVSPLRHDNWRAIYGDFRKKEYTEEENPVVMATYHDRYESLDLVYLLYRNGTFVEFTNRRGEMRTWYNEVKAAIVATYQERSGYVVGTGQDGEDRTVYTLEDRHLYPGIIRKANEQYRHAHPISRT